MTQHFFSRVIKIKLFLKIDLKFSKRSINTKYTSTEVVFLRLLSHPYHRFHAKKSVRFLLHAHIFWSLAVQVLLHCRHDQNHIWHCQKPHLDLPRTKVSKTGQHVIPKTSSLISAAALCDAETEVTRLHAADSAVCLWRMSLRCKTDTRSGFIHV